MKLWKHKLTTVFRRDAGFTIIEVIVAIVIIGITVPTIMTQFSGMEDAKRPEFIIQASFIAQKKAEELSSQFRDTITTACPEVTAATTTEGDYTIDCLSEQVEATDPDTTATSTFGRKITLTVKRTDGAMSDMVFNTLMALDDPS
jgi:prepilin-type N-terminal cleavage/methylation domain-containing protein